MILPEQITHKTFDNFRIRKLKKYIDLSREMGYNYNTFLVNLHNLKIGKSPAMLFRSRFAKYLNRNDITIEELQDV